jgi:hypothetical protein
MEELKQLIELVLKLPSTALWILAGYLFYKLSVIASIYGLIRYAIEKLHSVYYTKLTEAKKPVITLYKWKEGIEPVSEETKTSIVNALIRLKAYYDNNRSFTYVHPDYASLLDKLVNDYISQLPAKK